MENCSKSVKPLSATLAQPSITLTTATMYYHEEHEGLKQRKLRGLVRLSIASGFVPVHESSENFNHESHESHE